MITSENRCRRTGASNCRLAPTHLSLSHDGRDLAAALQTIFEIGDAPALNAAISDAFPGAQLKITGQDARLARLDAINTAYFDL